MLLKISACAHKPGFLMPGHIYSNIIDKQEARGFIERVEPIDAQPNVHFISHHSVAKDSSTTPLHIVFDCSCRQASR